jgi:hypothetical protein
MKTLNFLIIVLMLNLASGCATCRQSPDTQAASATQEAPLWKEFFGWLFECATNGAYEYGSYQQRIQSGDPTR